MIKHFGENAKGVTGLLAVVGVDVAVDGLVIGLGFAAGGNIGPLLVLALTVELVFLGLSIAASLTQIGTPPLKIIAATTLVALLLLIGAVVGVSLLGGFSGAPLAAFLSFALAALLYLVVEELLVEAHEKGDDEPEAPVVTAAFFVGFLVLLLLEEGCAEKQKKQLHL